MRTFKDTRGKAWFDIVPEMENYQIDLTTNYPDIVRAFHHHNHKTEWFFAASGEFKLVLTNPLETIYMSQGDVVRIDPGRWHGYQCLGLQPAIMLEVSSAKYDLEDPDDQKCPWNTHDGWEVERK